MIKPEFSSFFVLISVALWPFPQGQHHCPHAALASLGELKSFKDIPINAVFYVKVTVKYHFCHYVLSLSQVTFQSVLLLSVVHFCSLHNKENVIMFSIELKEILREIKSSKRDRTVKSDRKTEH